MEKQADDIFRVTLLGTGAPPPVLDRFGPSTLVEVGAEKFIFDAGRGAMQRIHQLGIPFADISGMFLTHHHSDHVGQAKGPAASVGTRRDEADDGISAEGVRRGHSRPQ